MPFENYKNFADCVKKNKGKADPETYCAEIKRKTEKVVNWNYHLTFAKIAETNDVMYIAGEASNPSEDEDGELMDMESLKGAYSKYMTNPVIKFMHDKAPQWRGAIGVVVEKYTDSDGKVWETSFGSKPFLIAKFYKNSMPVWMWNGIQKGIYKGFSIGGKALKKVAGRIYVKSWLETSVVDVPSANGAFFTVLKMACSGEDCPKEQIKKIEVVESSEVDSFVKAVNDYVLDSFFKVVTDTVEASEKKKEKKKDETLASSEEGSEKKGDHGAGFEKWRITGAKDKGKRKSKFKTKERVTLPDGKMGIIREISSNGKKVFINDKWIKIGELKKRGSLKEFSDSADKFISKGGRGSGPRKNGTKRDMPEIKSLEDKFSSMKIEDVKKKLLEYHSSGEILEIESKNGRNSEKALRATLQSRVTGKPVSFKKDSEIYTIDNFLENIR